MHEMSNRYLEDLRRGLRRLPEAERDDALREIGSHIAEAEAAGQPHAAVLAQLGDASALARAYIADFYLQQPTSEWTHGLEFMRVAVFVVGSGFLSLLVVPVLAVLVVTFGLTAIATPVVGVLQVLGLVPERVMYWGQPVPTTWVLPLTLAVSVVCAGIAWGAQRLLTRYLVVVLAGYRRLRPALVQ